MPLRDHLAELRTRLLISVAAVAVGAVLGWIWYEQIFAWITAPFVQVVDEAQAQGHNVTLALTGVADPFTLQLKVAGITGLVLASPVWLFQLWRFVTPGLHKNERAWALGFTALATPLFLAGMALAYLFLPHAIGFLFGFTPGQREQHRRRLPLPELLPEHDAAVRDRLPPAAAGAGAEPRRGAERAGVHRRLAVAGAGGLHLRRHGDARRRAR